MFSILFHELGHLSGYKITIKSNDWIIQIGTGKELFRTKRLRYHAILICTLFTGHPVRRVFLCVTVMSIS